VLKAGYGIGIPSVAASNSPSDFLHLQWSLSVEYTVFFIFFLASTFLAQTAWTKNIQHFLGDIGRYDSCVHD